jgi:hypothetical protein
VDTRLHRFYEELLDTMRGDGAWRLLECTQAWDGNWTWDCFIAWSWELADGEYWLIVVNYADHQSQCHVRLPFEGLRDRTTQLKDLMSSTSYERSGTDLVTRGLYLDMPAWGYHVFRVSVL